MASDSVMAAARDAAARPTVAGTSRPAQRAGAQVKVERGALDDDSTVPANAGVGATAAAAADAVGCRVAAVAGLFSVAATSGEEPLDKRRRMHSAFAEAEFKPESI